MTVTVDGATHSERMAYWPFTHEELQADLLATGLAGGEPWSPARRTVQPRHALRYLVTSRANSSNASR